MPTKVKCRNQFYHDGRGPSLIAVHLSPRGSHIEAIDFWPPDVDESPDTIQHLSFVRAQVYMFTPEEVENYPVAEVNWSATDNGALVSLGRSAWLRAFAPRHLANCEHYRAMFYDEYLDIICEDVIANSGAYARGL